MKKEQSTPARQMAAFSFQLKECCNINLPINPKNIQSDSQNATHGTCTMREIYFIPNFHKIQFGSN